MHTYILLFKIWNPSYKFIKILIRIWTVTILQTKYIIERFCQSDALWDLQATLSVVKKAVYSFQCLKIQKQTYMRKMNEAEIFCAWFADMLGSTKMSTYQNTCSNEWCNSIMKSFAATFLNNICTCRFNFHIRKKKIRDHFFIIVSFEYVLAY